MTHHTTDHDESADGLSGAKALLLIGFSFAAGFLLGRRRMEQTWDAGEPVEIADSGGSGNGGTEFTPETPVGVETESDADADEGAGTAEVGAAETVETESEGTADESDADETGAQAETEDAEENEGDGEAEDDE